MLSMKSRPRRSSLQMIKNFAATRSSLGPTIIETFEVLDLAICDYKAGLIIFDDSTSTAWLVYVPGTITWIVTFILNAAVSLAMYSLLNFYHLFGKELAPHKPLPKFLCIKGVVFFSFW
ncbi:hypothetical protein O6H91_01G006800 [Diphasiastrum complanatum]|uniref:Uncharacterized protein n=2 Tax=Diphasiastrum complanatum TaxID=34168 RepID=A0ACC2EMT4_DIPCM|nr:hypothetical protein O6H91_01G006800 [Diphasiastrum complanatum]KAJ7567777.1 hypothetical protein O6H91_01G006800 [Diphasiastrum complanatum]